MLNNLKNILIGVFSAIIVVAIGASAYTAFASPAGNEPAIPKLHPISARAMAMATVAKLD